MMMKLKEKIRVLSLKTSMPKNEIGVIFFILATGSIGFGIHLLNKPDTAEYKNYNYFLEDSLFNRAAFPADIEGINEERININVDYKQEVLDFNKPDFSKKKAEEPPALNSINLNTASREQLLRLPGIGEKTADNILQLKAVKGKFKNIDELLQVKGIGEAKFNKIKIYLYIEK
jgi:competence protein ComEA